MHLIIRIFGLRIAQGICFRKRYGFLIRKCTGIGKKTSKFTLNTSDGTIQTSLYATFLGPIPPEYTSDHPQTFCAHSSGHVLSENGGGFPSKMHGLG